MNIEIRPLQTHEEYRAVERLQRSVWNLDDVEIVPDHMLLTAHKNGGLLLGAFDNEAESQLAGFVFGFPGLTESGQLKHCSHMAGVAPAYQSRGLGYQLKLAQRLHVLDQGIDLITWTYDPLESRNAYLNFHKLGVTCRTYLRDLYGGMRDALNAGLPSDRFQVDWHIAGEAVERRLGCKQEGPASSPQVDTAPVVEGPGEGALPSGRTLAESRRLWVRIPADFQSIKAGDMALAQRWRLHTRALFLLAFPQGFVVIDLLHQDQRSYYLLEKREQ